MRGLGGKGKNAAEGRAWLSGIGPQLGIIMRREGGGLELAGTPS